MKLNALSFGVLAAINMGGCATYRAVQSVKSLPELVLTPVPLVRLVPKSLPVDACADCPNHELYLNPWEFPPFTALRFVADGHALEGEPFIVGHAPGDCSLYQPLRFGSVYLLRGNDDLLGRPDSDDLTCIRGRDTMQVYFLVPNYRNVVYDSIPFRAGRYYLALTPYARPPAADSYARFAIYFQQHEAGLTQAQPFASCRFVNDPHRPEVPPAYVPPTPADIFRLLLQYRHYEQPDYSLRPLAKGQQPDYH